MRTIDFRYKVLRNGADYGFLHAAAGTKPMLRMQESDWIKTSFSGEFAPVATDVAGKEVPVDYLTDELEPVMILDGQEHRLGVFLPATVTPTKTNGKESVRLECYDRSWRVRDTYAESMPYFEAGTNYLTAVETLLTAAGISAVYATPTTAVLAEDRQDWAMGTSYLEIVNTLLREINYKELWFDARGTAILEPASVPLAANIQHTLAADKVESLMLPTITRETDLYSAANVFLCICSNVYKAAPMTATAENTNPQSPLSISRRGRRIVQVVQVDNIANQAELQAYADRLRDESMISGETIRIATALLPGYGVGDVVALHYGDLSAICIERGWTMELSVGGQMTHELERVVYNIG